MIKVQYRWMQEAELARIGEIDRTETIRVGHEIRGQELASMDVEWNVPPFITDGEGEHTLAEQVRFCNAHLDNGGRCRGAFTRDRLIGIGILLPEIRPGMAQFAYLQVSNGYRRRGIATSIVEDLITLALELEQERIYVSATPSQSAVMFYSSFGFTPISDPLPELYELEPEDIHMIKTL